MENQKYYVVSSENVGPNSTDAYGNVYEECYTVTTTAPTTNMSREVKTEGWLGTSNDNCLYAHGEFSSEQEARDYIENKLGEYREVDSADLEHDEIAGYLPGNLVPMSGEESVNWCYEGLSNEISADTTDEEIEKMVAEWANDEDQYKIDQSAVVAEGIEMRDELKDAEE